VQAVLMECTVSSIHVTKTDLDEGILSFWLILVSCHLLNGQLRQQNVFYCFFTVHNCYFREREGERACVFVCVRKLRRSASEITALLLLTTLLVKYLLVFHSVDCGLWTAPQTVMTHSHLSLQLSTHTNEGQ